MKGKLKHQPAWDNIPSMNKIRFYQKLFTGCLKTSMSLRAKNTLICRSWWKLRLKSFWN